MARVKSGESDVKVEVCAFRSVICCYATLTSVHSCDEIDVAVAQFGRAAPTSENNLTSLDSMGYLSAHLPLIVDKTRSEHCMDTTTYLQTSC